MDVSLTCHRHGAAEVDITPHIQTIRYSRSRDVTASEGLVVTLKMSVVEATYKVRPGNWLVLRTLDGRALSFGYVTDVDAGLSRGQNRALVSDLVKVTTISWYELITRAHVYSPVGDTTSVGAFFSLSDYSAAIAPIIQVYTIGQIGHSLQQLFRSLGRIKLPESLGGEYLGDAVPVVYNEATRVAYAPDRIVEEVATTGGPATTFSIGATESGLGEMIQGAYQPDRTLIEMFCSLEPMPGEVGLPTLTAAQAIATAVGNIASAIVTTAAQAAAPAGPSVSSGVVAVTPEYKDSKLAQILGMRPVLIYRTTPWRTRPLHKSLVASKGYKGVDDAYLDELVGSILARFGVVPPPDPIADQHRRDQEELKGKVSNQIEMLKALYSAVTWDYARALAIYPEMIRSMKMRWSDAARVNMTTIAYATAGTTGVEASEAAGLPILYEDSVRNYGPRIARPTWPFVMIGSLEAGMSTAAGNPNGYTATIGDFLRAQAAQLMQFLQNAHLMATGTISLNYTDAFDANLQERVLYLPQAEIIKVALNDSLDIFYAYVDGVTHEYNSTDEGVDLASTTVSYSRGLFGFEEDVVRAPYVPAPEAPDQKPVGNSSRVSSRRAGTKRAPVTVNSLLHGGVELAVSFPVLRDLLVLDEDLPAPLRTYRTGKINNVVMHFTTGRFEATATSWTTEFQNRYSSKQGMYAPHIIIDKDGGVTQIIDTKVEAWHVIHEQVNATSVAVELIVPGKSGWKASEERAKQAAGGVTLPWPTMTDYVIIGSNGTSQTKTDFFGPTQLQKKSLREVLKALYSHIGIPLYHDPGSTLPKTVRRFGVAEAGRKLAAGGVWHHTQFYAGHTDAVGLDILEVLPGVVA